MVNIENIISQQLSIVCPTTIEFNDGRSTTLVPQRFIPVPDDRDRVVSLNGIWKSVLWPFTTDEATLASPATADRRWQKVTQPGKVQGVTSEVDCAFVTGWDRRFLKHLPEGDGAMVRRHVEIPAQWSGKRIFLRFNAVYPGGRFWCNGILLGEHLSGLSPVQWEVTDLVQPGQRALVAVRILRRYPMSELDMPRHSLDFSGISQDAIMFAVEQCHVSDVHLRSSVDPATRAGRLEGHITLNSQLDHQVSCRVAVRVVRDDHVAAELPHSCTVPPGSPVSVPVSMQLAGVALWNDEFPNLYTVEVRVMAGDAAEQRIAFRTAFRRFETAGERALLNGNPVKFRGVNHLTFHPEHGMHTPGEWLRRSLLLMKKANINAIRTHYAAPPELADLCDELGFYLLQELPIDWSGHILAGTECLGPILMRIEGLVRRDRHHPSLMVWSIGNENLPANMAEHDDFNRHYSLFDRFVKKLDPDRFTMFPPPGPANKIQGLLQVRHGDIADTHYCFSFARQLNETGSLSIPKSWEGPVETLSREQCRGFGWSGVWFSSEYCLVNYHPDLTHAPYLSIIDDVPGDPLSTITTQQAFIDRLRREWGYMREDPTCLGGAFFPWLCAGAGDPWGWVVWGEDADWGVVTSELLPKPSFWVLRVLYSPVWFPSRLVWRSGQTELSFAVTNHYNSIDLRECTLRTMMGTGGRFMGVLKEWKDIPIEGAPGRSSTLHIPLWNDCARESLARGEPVVCRCILLDPRGFRPVMSDIVVVPEGAATGADTVSVVPIGPDAL